ncbi:MAG TPA: toll/interleukin-1 receptor domain-containing protein [Dictyobacter sp.]|jgi:hypothetical protein|nr:toll/interleukin-1 receptor domain-containing protein [Dictyobacter sp.]
MANSQHLNILHQGVKKWNQWRQNHPEIIPDLQCASLPDLSLIDINFQRTNLKQANLSNAHLVRANLNNANLDQANLNQAKLRSAKLKATSLYQTNLSGAKMCETSLYKTCFHETILTQTNMYHATFFKTLLLNVNLQQTINLKDTFHMGPSTIGIDTIQLSQGKIPDVFLDRAGVSEHFLKAMRTFGREPFAYHSCFISYSSKNQEFTKQLYQDLRAAGVQCWYAPESLVTGEKFPISITQTIQSYQKVLLVLSKDALESDWVRREVELARQKEGNGKKEVLVPIQLDTSIANASVAWAAALRKRRHITSFENWQQPNSYQKSLQKLLEALRLS